MIQTTQPSTTLAVSTDPVCASASRVVPTAGPRRAVAPLATPRQGTGVSTARVVRALPAVSATPAHAIRQVDGLSVTARAIVNPSSFAIETSAKGALSGEPAWSPPA